MSVLPIAALPPELMHGKFAFYPAIVGVTHNEWALCRATGIEVLVVNTKTAEEMWISRRLIGHVSSVEAPVRIVGLLKQLEYKQGIALPHRRGVIEMPSADAYPRPLMRHPNGPATVVAIREEGPSESGIRRILRRSVAAALLACFVAMIILRVLRQWNHH